MAWHIHCYVRDPLTHSCEQKVIGPYDTQDLARWWAVNLAQRGSVTWNINQPDEQLIPISSIVRMDIKEHS